MAFHWKEGWYFERLKYGSVRIYHEDPATKREGEVEFAEIDVVIDIDQYSWASIMASVSARGETSKTFQEAREFHNKQ